MRALAKPRLDRQVRADGNSTLPQVPQPMASLPLACHRTPQALAVVRHLQPQPPLIYRNPERHPPSPRMPDHVVQCLAHHHDHVVPHVGRNPPVGK